MEEMYALLSQMVVIVNHAPCQFYYQMVVNKKTEAHYYRAMSYY